MSAGGSWLRSGQKSCLEFQALGRRWRWGRRGGARRISRRRRAHRGSEEQHRKVQVLMSDWAFVSSASHSGLVSFHTYSNILETHANDEIGSPVGTTCNSHGSRSGTLWEELSHKEPGDGAWSHLKEGHEAKDGQHADVTHPWYTVLSDRKQERGKWLYDHREGIWESTNWRTVCWTDQ